MIVFPNCKINLGLHVLRRRTDGFHDLETAFYPVALLDALEIVQPSQPLKESELSLSGLPVSGDPQTNSCIQAWKLLKADFPQLPPVQIHLHKVIPSGAGLGGGSADGAFALQLLNQKFHLQISEQALAAYALKLGSDCPFFLYNRPCIARGRGEQTSPVTLDLTAYKLVLVNPGIHVPTAWAFSRIRPHDDRPPLAAVLDRPIAEWRDRLVNDFEAPVFEAHPEIGRLKDLLYKSGARYASLSGSGSTVYGIFEKGTLALPAFPAHYGVWQI